MAEPFCAHTQRIAAWPVVAVLCVIAVGLVAPALCADKPVGENQTTGENQKTGKTEKTDETKNTDETEKTGKTQPGKDATGTQVDLTKLSIEELMDVEVSIKQMMSTEVIVVSKTPQKLSQTLVPVFVITRDDIDRFGYRTVDDALKQVTGIYVSNERVYEFVGVRGILRKSDNNTRILFLVNGHKVNEMQFEWAKADDVFPVDIDTVERIDVVKGPGSAVWGANAELAVVNVTTRDGRDIDGVGASVEYGSYNRLKGFLEYGRREKNGFDVSASLSGMQSDGEHRIFLAEWQHEPDKNGGIAVNSNASDATHAYLSAAYEGVRFFYARSSEARADTLGDPGFFSSPAGHFTDTRTLGELSYEQKISPKNSGNLLFRIFTDANKFEVFFFEQEPPQDETLSPSTVRSGINFPPTPGYFRDGSSTWGSELRYSWNASPRLSMVAGLEYNTLYAIKTSEPGGRDTFYSLNSYYLEADAKLGKTTRFVGGVRYDDYTFGDTALSPRLGIVHNVSPTSTLRLLYGQAFRPPTTFEAFFAVHGLGLPALIPEKMVTYELVWEQLINENNRLVASLFVDQLRDMIDSDLYMNVGRVISRGIEAQLETRLPSGIVGYGGFCALKAWNNTTGKQLDNAPGFTMNAGISVPVMSRKYYLSADAQYVSSRIAENIALLRRPVPAYCVTNVILSKRRSKGSLDLSLGLYNLFNVRYFDPVSTDVPPLTLTQVPQPGRTVRLQINYAF